MRGSAFVFVLLTVFLGWGPGAAQSLTPALDHARRQSISEGRGLGGIRLGDTEEEIMKKLGGPPLRIGQSPDGARRDLIYAAVGPEREWGIVLQITLTLRQGGAEAIWLTVGRRPPASHQYLGRTARGYLPGEPKERILAIYGNPDETITGPPGTDEIWWYRAEGLLVVPGEKQIRGENQSKLAVVRPNLSLEELRRHVLGP